MSDSLFQKLESHFGFDNNVESVWYMPLQTSKYINLGDETVEMTKVAEEDSEDEFTSRVYFVVEVNGRTFIRYGQYTSHYGYDWEYGEFREVEPTTKTITVWA